MSQTVCPSDQLTFWAVGKQTVTVDFSGGAVVSDAGLLAVRRLDRKLDVLRSAARRLPDPRSQEFVTHSTERILTQRVYQILGGYFDGNDAQELRHDPLFQTLCDRSPRDDQPLASGSTLNRFQHAYTRREAEKPPEERDVLFEQRAAHVQRIKQMNRYLVDLFIKTRRVPPERIVLDLDATDDPTHGDQQLSLFDGYRKQYQYKPLLVLEGETGFPLGGYLRPGTAHDSWGAVDALREIVAQLRAHWPDVPILVRGDSGLALPEVYDFCEAEKLAYALGFSTNEVLKRKTQLWLNLAQAKFDLYEEKQQLFTAIHDYQVGAVVQTSMRRVWFHFSSTWPRRGLFARICHAVDHFVEQLIPGEPAGMPP